MGRWRERIQRRDDWNWERTGIEVKTQCIGNAMKPTRVTLSKNPIKGTWSLHWPSSVIRQGLKWRNWHTNPSTNLRLTVPFLLERLGLEPSIIVIRETRQISFNKRWQQIQSLSVTSQVELGESCLWRKGKKDYGSRRVKDSTRTRPTESLTGTHVCSQIRAATVCLIEVLCTYFMVV